MERIVRPQAEPQTEDTRPDAGMLVPVAHNRTVGDTHNSVETTVRTLIAAAGFAFDPLVVLA